MLLETILVAVLSISDINTDSLEQYYWDCDTAYMKQQLGGQDMNSCLAITDEFIKRKFNGNMNDFYDYWRKNRTKEWNKRDYYS